MGFFYPSMTCVWCIFRFIFKFVLPRLFLKLWLSLLLNVQKQWKKLWKNREWRDKKKKKVIINSKKGFKRLFIYDVRKNGLNFGPPPPLPIYPQTSNFDLSRPQSCTFFNWHSKLFLLCVISEFSFKILTVRSTYWRIAFSLLMHI